MTQPDWVANPTVPQPARVRLELPYLPPYAYSSNGRGHWTARRGAKTGVNHTIVEDIHFLLVEAGWPVGERIIERASISVTFILPDRRKRDHDGLIQRLKPVYDALVYRQIKRGGTLVARGLLRDDGLDYIGWPRYGHRYQKGVSMTIIELEEV